jgi:catechol 2,3-dioxygenase-like lactoylglutathione lyase family enzyme
MNLNQVTISSRNVKESVEFYKRIGLNLIVDAQPHYVRFECPDGEATFSIHENKDLKNSNGTMIYFEEEDLDQYVKDLSKAGIVFDEMPNDKDWLWREARLKDPDGNNLIIYWAGDNRKNPPWRI